MWVHEVEQHYSSYEGTFTNTVRMYVSKASADALSEYLNDYLKEIRESPDPDYRKAEYALKGELGFLPANFSVQDWSETSFHVVSHQTVD